MGTTFGPLITVSATYGTGGSVIAPRLAEAMGLPFVDRLISADMSQDAALATRSASESVGNLDPGTRPRGADRDWDRVRVRGGSAPDPRRV